MIELLDKLVWYLVRARWSASGGVPSALTLILDSTVVLDNFRWEDEEVDGPVTVPRVIGPRSQFVFGEPQTLAHD